MAGGGRGDIDSCKIVWRICRAGAAAVTVADERARPTGGRKERLGDDVIIILLLQTVARLC